MPACSDSELRSATRLPRLVIQICAPREAMSIKAESLFLPQKLPRKFELACLFPQLTSLINWLESRAFLKNSSNYFFKYG
ncbi:MAG: DUF2550 domain-containing protein, partial [Terrimicrobiaceae bacterium]|nr:DUF2550 domain-containing protein [Terrimicrobiaceae bacterium]